ncbi:MAG: alternate F1F0 ATPase, F1 subunit alpha [Hyphomicrobiales bacterium]|nr:alternate F1F0 ATPase, F1 subunit alpha [Hyphomicrobiales bacterium]
MLKEVPGEAFTTFDQVLARKRARLDFSEVGKVANVSSGVAEVHGFTEIAADELVRFADGTTGMATNLEYGRLGTILLGNEDGLHVGSDVRRTHRVVDVPVGDRLLGRVVDALGRPLDAKGIIKPEARRAVERPAPPIIERAPVETPLQTGIKAIDAIIPIGRGQRELIIGDRQTGKTAVAIDSIISQQGSGVVSIYCAIGQRGDAVARVIEKLEQSGALKRGIVVVAAGEDAPGLQFVAPYAATTMAEWFMEAGKDVLIVYDDLTRHARAYRQLSLLLRRPPGREAYPGDIFYIHSRLLERSTHLNRRRGGGSMTALPIIETQAQNLSAYIPTNLISITDGQIYLSPELFRRGQLPAIDIGKSVSRVGGRAQLPAFRTVAGLLKLSYGQFEELETFARFGTRLDDVTRGRLDRGRRVRQVLRQQESTTFPVAEQIAVLHAVTQGLFDHLDLEDIEDAETIICGNVRRHLSDLCRAIESGEPFHGEYRGALLHEARRALRLSESDSRSDTDSDGNA